MLSFRMRPHRPQRRKTDRTDELDQWVFRMGLLIYLTVVCGAVLLGLS